MLKNKSLHKQQGAVLIVSLMLLVVLTMLGVSALNSTKFETRMAANTAEYNRTFQVAEIGIAIPRNYTNNVVIGIDSDDKVGFQDQADDLINGYRAEFTTRRAPALGQAANTGQSAGNVFFIVESIGTRVVAENDMSAIQVQLSGGMTMLAPAGPMGDDN